MIKEINIKNFKSIVDLTLDLGRFNVVIGANGCGKTNILEAIAFAAAANTNKLDDEFLMNRDLRLTKPELMINAFEEGSFKSKGDRLTMVFDKCILLSILESEKSQKRITIGYNKQSDSWGNLSLLNNPKDLEFVQRLLLLEPDSNSISDSFPELVKEKYPKEYEHYLELFGPSLIDSFIIYHPLENYLKEVKKSFVFPIGIKGEGLLHYLKEKSHQLEYVEMFEAINEGLGMLDWFDGVDVPSDLLSNEYKLSIGDKYLRDSMHFFDQRSTNEGFMFLLFYLTLFNSKDTPPFFSIDNIETALNPRLCTELISRLIHTTKEKNKQVIVTTHSPFVLDGLDLSDDEVRLFVARRDIDGHTRIERVIYREDRNMPLSELWMSGLIGGLPDNF